MADVSIFEGEDEAVVAPGPGSELSAATDQDLRLDPLRGAIGSLHEATGERVGTILTEVEVWFRRVGMFVKRSADPREVVRVEVVFEPTQVEDDGYPVVFPWVETWLERDDEMLGRLLEGQLPYPDRDELTVRWFDAAEAPRERARLRSA